MKMMIWKELRENARWAALAFFCLLLAEIFALSSVRQSTENITLCSSAFLLVSAFGCCAIGALIGALQIVPELRRDQWASLLHRPVLRGVIFLGKVIAGLCLYALATGLPLIISVIYVAWPGQFPAPFVPGLMLPAVSDLLLGVVFYFVAMLLSLHHAKWLGARSAIALAAVGVLALHLKGNYPFTLPLLAAALFFFAASGAMRGAMRVRPWMTRLALGCVILTGVQTALFLCATTLLWQRNVFSTVDYSDFRIASDGSVFLFKSGDKGGHTLVDMNGNAVTDERYLSNESSGSFLYPIPLSFRSTEPIWKLVRATTPARESLPYVRTVNIGYDEKEIWYLIPGARSYFIGYDRLSARCIGICDADGFKNARAKPRPFSTEPQSHSFVSAYLYSVGPELLAIDFRDRQMTALFNAGNETIYGAVSFPYTSEHRRIAVARTSDIRILESNGAPLFTLPYGHDPELWRLIEITATEDFSRMFLQYSPSYLAGREAAMAAPDRDSVIYLDEINATGQRVHTYQTMRSRNVPVPTWRTRLADLAKLPVLVIIARACPPQSETPQIIPFANDLRSTSPSGLAMMVAAFSLIALVWARRADLSLVQMAIWIGVTILFGAAGLLACRLSTDWPVLVRCPRCARRRGVRADSCSHCHAQWLAPPATGAEIFEPFIAH